MQRGASPTKKMGPCALATAHGKVPDGVTAESPGDGLSVWELPSSLLFAPYRRAGLGRAQPTPSAQEKPSTGFPTNRESLENRLWLHAGLPTRATGNAQAPGSTHPVLLLELGSSVVHIARAARGPWHTCTLQATAGAFLLLEEAGCGVAAAGRSRLRGQDEAAKPTLFSANCLCTWWGIASPTCPAPGKQMPQIPFQPCPGDGNKAANAMLQAGTACRCQAAKPNVRPPCRRQLPEAAGRFQKQRQQPAQGQPRVQEPLLGSGLSGRRLPLQGTRPTQSLPSGMGLPRHPGGKPWPQQVSGGHAEAPHKC